MKVGKIVVAGLVVTIFNSIVGAVTCGGLFGWVYKLEPTNVWKPMDGPPGWDFFFGSLALSIILAFVYGLLKDGIPGPNKLVKGLVYGLCVWAVGMLPGMYATLSFMTVAPQVVAYWTVLGLVQTPLQGLLIAWIYGE